MATMNRWASVFWGSVFLAVGVWVLLEASLPTLMLPTTGVPTHGIVEKLNEVVATHDGVSKHHVYYVFASESGENVHGHTQLSAESWASLRKGQTLTVLYWPTYPSANLLAEYPQWWVSYLVMITFPPAFGGIGFWWILSGLAPSFAAKVSTFFRR